ncbi:unnamed protein product [Vitrella brassicaformis CCMP3155]|uniref:Uncharacterized protein n=1 Tax=Vitrella brassicaformis (strain CCMP3155) TaxID=1169540 RepID=A0A0G4E9B8_VITBC|nr:unnamed protein product [Vitrella brassicaformis CCMP3155]|eukprot:CEL91837.1 unnamed protein product [Vitrella brassicaformis CCMP3155]
MIHTEHPLNYPISIVYTGAVGQHQFGSLHIDKSAGIVPTGRLPDGWSAEDLKYVIPDRPRTLPPKHAGPKTAQAIKESLHEARVRASKKANNQSAGGCRQRARVGLDKGKAQPQANL